MWTTFLSCGQKHSRRVIKEAAPTCCCQTHDSRSKKQKVEYHLENKPLKNALTFTWGFGIIPAFRYRKSILLYLQSERKQIKHGFSLILILHGTLSVTINTSVPGLDLLSSTKDWLCRVHIQLQEVHTSVAVGAEQGRTSRLGPLHVPAGQTQPESAVLRQKPLTQGPANAAAGPHRRRDTFNKEDGASQCNQAEYTEVWKSDGEVSLRSQSSACVLST